MPHSPKDSFRILELNPDASLEAVKRSYRSLVKLWHPDRYTPGSSMQTIAQEKIKDINQAYADLCKRLARPTPAAATGPGPVRTAYAAGSATREPPPPRRPSRPVETAPPPRRPRATGRPETADQERARTVPRRKPETRDPAPDAPRPGRTSGPKPSAPARPPRLRSIRPIVLSVLGIGFVAAVVIFLVNRWPVSATESSIVPSPLLRPSTATLAGDALVELASTSAAVQAGENLARPRTEAPLGRAEPRPTRWHEFVSPATETKVPLVASPEAFQLTFSAAVFGDLPRAARGFDPAEKPFWQRSLETAADELDAFSVGTSRVDVIKLQGRPDRETAAVLCYGTSTVLLAGGKVVGWHRGDTPLKAREEREVAYDLAVTFTIGSSKAEVLAVQGPPQHASDHVFQYGSSTVEFRDGRVVGWREGVPALRVHVMAEASYGRTERFTVGSTRAQVLAIQGPPDLASESVLQYGTAKVILQEGRVTSWQDRMGLLRARLVAAERPRPGS